MQRYVKSERFCGLEIDYKFNPGRKFDRQISRLCASEQYVVLFWSVASFSSGLATIAATASPSCPSTTGPREHGRSRYGIERYVRGFLDLLTVSFIGRYRHRPLHLFGGLGLLLAFVGFVILVYLTVVKILGHAIGQRPLLLLGVLLVVVGVQFFRSG